MSAGGSTLPDLVGELRRRKVWQVAAIYVVVTLAVAGGANDILPRLQLPDWTVTFVIVLTILGFPIAIALAWTYDITRGGIERTAEREDASTRPREAGDAAYQDIAAETSSEASIVVLPFDNLSPDPENAYFTDGLTDELIADLSLVKSLRVISRTSAMQLKGTDKDLRTIGRELGVRYVLEGSVRREGSDLRITAQLIDAARDSHLWAEKYGGTVEDVFDIQEKVSRAIADALAIELSPGERRRLSTRPVDDLLAYECYLKARHQIWMLTEQSLDAALALLERGLEMRPLAAPLHASKAVVYAQYLNTGSKAPSEYPMYLAEARSCAAQALALDPGDSTALYAQGCVHWFDADPPGAVAHWARAIEVNPNDTDALHLLGFALYAGGRELDRARTLLTRAGQNDPLSPISSSVAAAYPAWYGGDFRALLEAFGAWQKEVDRTGAPFPRLLFAYLYAGIGDLGAADRLFDKILCDTPDHPAASAAQLLCHALRREKEQALASVTKTLEDAAWWDDYFPIFMAAAYTLLGDHERALPWVDRAIDMGTTNVAFLGEHEPFLRRLRGDSEFDVLLHKARERSEMLTNQVNWAADGTRSDERLNSA